MISHADFHDSNFHVAYIHDVAMTFHDSMSPLSMTFFPWCSTRFWGFPSHIAKTCFHVASTFHDVIMMISTFHDVPHDFTWTNLMMFLYPPWFHPISMIPISMMFPWHSMMLVWHSMIPWVPFPWLSFHDHNILSWPSLTFHYMFMLAGDEYLIIIF